MAGPTPALLSGRAPQGFSNPLWSDIYHCGGSVPMGCPGAHKECIGFAQPGFW